MKSPRVSRPHPVVGIDFPALLRLDLATQSQIRISMSQNAETELAPQAELEVNFESKNQWHFVPVSTVLMGSVR